MTHFDKIIEWNRERNLMEFDSENEYRLLKEELEEFRDGTTPEEIVDALCDIIVVATGAMFKLGYDPDVAMNETIKEISSRRGSINQRTGKWEKDKSQDPSTLYKADYSKAKV